MEKLTRRVEEFKLGRTVTTAGALDKISEEERNEAILKHSLGHWGEVSENDFQANDGGLIKGQEDMLLSVYFSKDGDKFYVITEWDRSCTTVLLPEEY